MTFLGTKSGSMLVDRVCDINWEALIIWRRIGISCKKNQMTLRTGVIEMGLHLILPRAKVM